MKFSLLFCLVCHAMAVPLNESSNKFGGNLLDSDNDYIVGGTPAKEGEAPYQVSLQYGANHFCGGSIVSENWIVTAGHCVDGLPASALKIRYNTLTHNSGGNVVQAELIISHEKYNSYKVNNDIALIKLATSLTLGQTNANSVPLTKQNSDPAPGAYAIISGWGTTQEGGHFLPTNLQIVALPVISRDECKSKYGKAQISENMFCAGLEKGGKDSCQGDSGGPVIVNGELTGIVSWGYGCARPKYPGVYTRVSNYIDWIEKKIRQN